MSKIEYREDKASRRAAKKRYRHFLWSLKKDRLLCRDKDRKAKYTLRINALKDSFNKSDYPAGFDGKLAVYTVLFGDYDSIKPVHNAGGNCDYYIVTDREVDEKSGWKKINFDFPDNLIFADNATKNRYLKMHPEVLFPDYEYSLYLDATIQPVCDMFPLLSRLGEHFIGMFLHETRNCIYKEAEVVVRIGKAKKEDVDLLLNRYRTEGFPEDFGLTAGGVILRRHNCPECKKVMNLWWEMFINGPKRDQLSLMYCMWKCGYTLNDFAILGADYDLDPRLASESHK